MACCIHRRRPRLVELGPNPVGTGRRSSFCRCLHARPPSSFSASAASRLHPGRNWPGFDQMHLLARKEPTFHTGQGWESCQLCRAAEAQTPRKPRHPQNSSIEDTLRGPESRCGAVGIGEDDRGRALLAAEREKLARCGTPSASSDEMPSSSMGFGGPLSSVATRTRRAENWRVRSAVASFCASSVVARHTDRQPTAPARPGLPGTRRSGLQSSRVDRWEVKRQEVSQHSAPPQGPAQHRSLASRRRQVLLRVPHAGNAKWSPHAR